MKTEIKNINYVRSVSILAGHQYDLNNRQNFPQCHREDPLYWSNTLRITHQSNNSYCWFDLHLFRP